MARYDVTVRRDVRIPTADGDVTLSADLFLPAGADPVPVLITVLPYRRDAEAMNGSASQRWFAARGYAALLVDLRGTGSSGGVRRPAFDPGELDDALAAIDWAVRQPWCDGTVGMWGHSYGAMLALRTASSRPPALRAIIAAQGFLDPERDFAHPGGSVGAFGPLGVWGIGNLVHQLLPPLDDTDDPAEQQRWRQRLDTTPYLLDLYREGPDHPAWAARRVQAAAIEVPALCVAGWRDLFVDPTIRAYEALTGPKQLIAGPWMHTMPHGCPFTPIDFHELALSWWDRWLRGAPHRVDHPVGVYVQGGKPRWLGFDDWPPGAPHDVDVSAWQRTAPDQPDPAVGLRSGLWAVPAGAFGLPMDQHDDDAGSLCYTSPPLPEPMLIAGRPRLTLADPWPRVSVKLTEVDPAGRSTLICAGLATGAAEIELTPTAYEIPEGHRLRIVVATGDFPRVWPKRPPPGWPAVAALSLPVCTAGRPIDYPAPAGDGNLPAQVVEGPPVWELVDDLFNRTVSLRLAGIVANRPDSNTHRRKHRLRIDQHFRATADRGDPDASSVAGNVTATVDTETGQHITVEVDATVTATQLTATATVTADGTTLLDRTWRA